MRWTKLELDIVHLAGMHISVTCFAVSPTRALSPRDFFILVNNQPVTILNL
jgi:hypothetical protein